MSKTKVLVIEDNSDNLGLVRFLLEQADFEVIGARDGKTGLEAAYQSHPALILLDMSLPEVSGWQVAHELKSNPDTSSVKVVALTAHTLPGDRKKALDAGCDGFISKPLDVPNFVKQVQDYLK